MTIACTAEIEAALAKQSQQRGLTPDELAQQILRDGLGLNARTDLAVNGAAEVEEEEGTLADMLAGYIGVIDSRDYVPGGARLSEDTGRKFAAGMLEKKRLGKL